jgi:hypothetical protein
MLHLETRGTAAGEVPMIRRYQSLALAAALCLASPLLAAQVSPLNPFAVEREGLDRDHPGDGAWQPRHGHHHRHDRRLAWWGERLERHGDRMERRGRSWERRGERLERRGYEYRGRLLQRKGDRLQHRGDRLEHRGWRLERRAKRGPEARHRH